MNISNTNFPSLAIYLHIPFCRTRCTYCDFNTYTNQSDRITPYMYALVKEARLVAGGVRRAAHTIYFGGGTPSLLPVPQLEEVLKALHNSYAITANAEITLETNPGTVDDIYLKTLRRSGINRLSIGMQTANANELKLFARDHNLDDVQKTVGAARSAGFDNLSLDLIYGAPHQTLASWRNSLETALRLQPEHLSLYALGIEDGTPMQRWISRGVLPEPDSDLAAEMYDLATDLLARAGFVQYEISNWCLPGRESQHNIQYWRNLPYLGLGAGAHGYANRKRYATVRHPAQYIKRMTDQVAPLDFPLSEAADIVTEISEVESMGETMFMGLRLIQEGVSGDDFQRTYGTDMWNIYQESINKLEIRGLLERTSGNRLRLTSQGRLLGNQVFMEFI